MSSQGPFGSSAFFVNKLRSNWDRVEKGSIVLALSCQNDLDVTCPPTSIRDFRGCDLTLTWGSTLTLTFKKQKVYHCMCFAERITMALEFWLYGNGVMSQKSNPKLWIIDLTSEVTDWTETLIWVPIVASRNCRHARFSATLIQLGTKMAAGVVPPPLGRDRDK